jgi:hypothetical protein
MTVKRPIQRVSKRELLDGMRTLVHDDHLLTAKLVEYIGEIDRRQLYLESAYPSMFAFCVGRYKMSESTAAKRIRAGRAACRFPRILDMVRKGQLHLTAVHQLAAHLTESNEKEVLRRARGRTSKEIEELIAEIAPRPDGRSMIRPVLPAAGAKRRQAEGEAQADLRLNGPHDDANVAAQAIINAAPRLPTNSIRSVTVPLSPQRYRLHVTIGKEAVDQLEEIVSLMSHQLPNGDVGQVLERAISLLLEDTKKRRAALTKQPRRRKKKPGAIKSRTIPAEVKRQVFTRDDGRCAFVDAKGNRCNSSWQVEFHHVVPFGRNGPNTVDNIQLRCRAHNQYEAELEYGPKFMKKKRRKSA